MAAAMLSIEGSGAGPYYVVNKSGPYPLVMSQHATLAAGAALDVEHGGRNTIRQRRSVFGARARGSATGAISTLTLVKGRPGGALGVPEAAEVKRQTGRLRESLLSFDGERGAFGEEQSRRASGLEQLELSDQSAADAVAFAQRSKGIYSARVATGKRRKRVCWAS